MQRGQGATEGLTRTLKSGRPWGRTPTKGQECPVNQGSPTPGPWTGTGPRPVRNRATQQEVSGRRASEASSDAPHHSHYHLSHLSPPRTVPGKIVFHETGPWCQKGWGPLQCKPSEESIAGRRKWSAVPNTTDQSSNVNTEKWPLDLATCGSLGTLRRASSLDWWDGKRYFMQMEIKRKME